jgi:predicted transcriptional regulator
MTTTMRVPTQVNDSVKRIAALQGRAPSDLIAEAWNCYLERHREQFAKDFEEAAALIREGDTAGLAQFASRSVVDRAAAAAAAARAPRATD